IAWTIIFFVASAAASSAYLTVSEIFPLEIRGMAIAIFFAVGTLVGGAGAPLLFGWIIGMGSSTALFMGSLMAAVLMIFAAAVEAWIGAAAEARSREHIAERLSRKGVSSVRVRRRSKALRERSIFISMFDHICEQILKSFTAPAVRDRCYS